MVQRLQGVKQVPVSRKFSRRKALLHERSGREEEAIKKSVDERKKEGVCLVSALDFSLIRLSSGDRDVSEEGTESESTC